MDEPASKLLIGIVGPCGSGKSTLLSGLERSGFRCRHIAQEHSYVQYMWQHITNPDILIFLDASFETATQRRKLNWTVTDYEEQQRRLSHARQHAALIIPTDSLSAEEVLDQALRFLKHQI
jgi:cytidylate kinase